MSTSLSEWRRSTRCDSGTCVEVANDEGQVQIRDGKRPEGGVIVLKPETFSEFIAGIKAGVFDA